MLPYVRTKILLSRLMMVFGPLGPLFSTGRLARHEFVANQLLLTVERRRLYSFSVACEAGCWALDRGGSHHLRILCGASCKSRFRVEFLVICYC